MGSSYEADIKNEEYREKSVGYCNCNRSTNESPIELLVDRQEIGLYTVRVRRCWDTGRRGK